jgi:outer membrane receptor protein involved in Fe transport
MLIRRTVCTVLATMMLTSVATATDSLQGLMQIKIEPQPVSEALLAFSDQTKVQIVSVGTEVKGLLSPGVEGKWQTAQALTRLLQGTGLKFELISDNTVRIFAERGEGKPASSLSLSRNTMRLAQASSTDSAAGSEQGTSSGEQSSADTSSSAADAKVEEIVVTAQKRMESIRDVPISAQVVTGQRLTEQNFNSLEDLTQVIPGVKITTGGYTNNLTVRGVSSGENPSLDQSVATFVDDIYRGRSKLSGATFLDLERVEFLKGPQSTFFGNNAIAGAFNIVTRKPGDHFSASTRALYGEDGEYALEVGAGGPITRALGVRVAAIAEGGDGWLRNTFTGEDVPHSNNKAGRVTFALQAAENLDVTLKLEASKNRSDGFQQMQLLCTPPAPIPSSYTGVCPLAQARGVTIGDLEANETSGLAGQGSQLETHEGVLTFNYQLGQHTLTSVSGYYQGESSYKQDAFGLPPPAEQTFYVPEKNQQLSQELRLASPTGGPFEYLVGAYFQRSVQDWSVFLNFNSYTADFIGQFPGFEPILPYLPVEIHRHSHQVEKIASLFGSLSWHVTDDLKVTGGLRDSRVEKRFDAFSIRGTGSEVFGGFVPFPASCAECTALAADLVGPPRISNELERTDKALMPSVNVQYSLLPDVMLYARYDRGFLAGGFNNQQTNLSVDADLPFGSEHVDAYELGVKSSAFDRRLFLAVAAFHSTYDGLQVSSTQFDSVLNLNRLLLRNAGGVRSQGVELEADWAPVPAARIFANVTYLDAKFTRFTGAPLTNLQGYCATLSESAFNATPECVAVTSYPVPAFGDATGSRTPYAPSWSGSVRASYKFGLPGGYLLTSEVSPFFTAEYFTSPSNDPVNRIPGYVRYDARVSLDSPNGQWHVDLIGKNLADKVIIQTRSLDGVIRANPRTVAAQVRYQF